MLGSFENLYFYLNRHHTAEHKQGDDRVALASDFKGKIRSQQNKQKSGGSCCLCSAVTGETAIFSESETSYF